MKTTVISKNIVSFHFISIQSRDKTSSIWRFKVMIFVKSCIILYLLQNSREYAHRSIRAVCFINGNSYESWKNSVYIFHTDVISLTHDRVAGMIEYGMIMGIFSKLCFNHGLNLALTDVLYKKQNLHVLKKKK